MEPNYSERSRALLKLDLTYHRSLYSPGFGYYPVCPICEKPILPWGDMHEALITRGDVAGHEQAELIYSPYNCVILHHECHNRIAGHGGPEVFEKCAQHLAAWEGISSVRTWLAVMAAVFPVVGLDTLRRYEAIQFDS